ncbi:Double-stranded RNA-binding protein 2 [Salvia divinorum]|uniref:Double-stranded RNA-binding protein 2 n=1 Tax=Salvia divinorum TaxID=28513 RepID=A0ABD1HQQ1_SALDI
MRWGGCRVSGGIGYWFYTCIREGPDHAPRFKAIVNFNGQNFQSPNYCSTLRQAEHTAAEAALEETGVYTNLVQEIAQRVGVGSPLPQYTTFRSGLGHLPVLTGTVELAGIIFTGEPAKSKKQAEKNAALAAWLSLKQLAQQEVSSPSESECNDEQEQIRLARALQNYRSKEKLLMPNLHNASIPFQRKFMAPTPRPSSPQRPTAPTSQILPFFCQKTASRTRPPLNNSHNTTLPQLQPSPEIRTTPHVFRGFLLSGQLLTFLTGSVGRPTKALLHP